MSERIKPIGMFLYPRIDILGIIREPGKDPVLHIRDENGVTFLRKVRTNKFGAYILFDHIQLYIADAMKMKVGG